MTDVDNSLDYIDIRNVIERFEELEGEREALKTKKARKEWDEDNGEEFATLKKLLEDLEGNGGDHDWRGSWYPVTLIRDSYFVEAMQELCEDIGAVSKDVPVWLEIDWEKTADNLRQDYSSVEYDGVTYWYR